MESETAGCASMRSGWQTAAAAGKSEELQAGRAGGAAVDSGWWRVDSKTAAPQRAALLLYFGLEG